MKRSRPNQISLVTKLADGKSVKVKVPQPRPAMRLDDMNQAELEKEMKELPGKITQARQVRDNLFGALKARWSTAYANDTEFVQAYARAEAAGHEVVSLLERLLKASRIHHERYSRRLV